MFSSFLTSPHVLQQLCSTLGTSLPAKLVPPTPRPCRLGPGAPLIPAGSGGAPLPEGPSKPSCAASARGLMGRPGIIPGHRGKHSGPFPSVSGLLDLISFALKARGQPSALTWRRRQGEDGKGGVRGEGDYLTWYLIP